MAATRYLTVVSALLMVIYAQNYRQSDGIPQAPNRFNFFDVELLKKVIEKEGAHNIVISPASTKAVLGMLLEGAEGDTAQQIEKTLRLRGYKVSHQMIFNSFLQSLKVRYPGTLVELASQIFLSSGLQVKREYQEALDQIYHSGVYNVDFSAVRQTAQTINGWVGKNTHNLIRTLISPDSIDRNTKALVANALYFKGKWAVPFNPKATTIRCFQVVPNMCKNASFMEAIGRYGYADLKDLNAKVLEIPYQGTKFSMLFLLPNHGLDELLRDLSYQPLNTIIPKIETMTVVTSIPRFSIEFKTDLSHPLMQLGIKDIFTPAANFSGIFENGGNILINQILQKAVIEVNEEGTVGAAATGAVAVPLQGNIIPKFQASKPFLFFVRDIETGHYLFEGLVEQPELVMEDVNRQPNAATAERGGPSLTLQSDPLSAGSSDPTGANNPQIQPTNNPNVPDGGVNKPTTHGNSDEGRIPAASNYQFTTGAQPDSFNYPPF